MVSIQTSGHLCQASLSGEATIYNASENKKTLAGAFANKAINEMELDLSGVEEMDLTGVQLVILMHKEANATGKTFTVAAHSRTTLDVFKTLGLLESFNAPVRE